MFLSQERPFAGDAPAVAGEGAVGADDAVAGDGDGDLVGGAGPGDGADGCGLADALGDFGIGGGLAEGDFGEGFPYFLLESGALNIEREKDTLAWIFDEADDFGDELLEGLVAADEVRAGKAVLKFAGEGVGIVAKKNGADAFVGGGNENRAERTLADGEADDGPRAAAAEIFWRHAENLGGVGVKTGVGIVAGLINCAGDSATAGECRADFCGAVRGGVGLGAEAGGCGEDTLEMEGAHADGAGEVGERGRILGGLDDAAGAGDDFRVMGGESGHAMSF